MTRQGGTRALESSDGGYAYYAKDRAPRLWRVPVAGGVEELMLEASGGPRVLVDCHRQRVYFFEVWHGALVPQLEHAAGNAGRSDGESACS